jgi:hypothetical protein
MPGDTADRQTPFQRTTKVAGTSGRLRSEAEAHFDPDPRRMAPGTPESYPLPGGDQRALYFCRFRPEPLAFIRTDPTDLLQASDGEPSVRRVDHLRC